MSGALPLALRQAAVRLLDGVSRRDLGRDTARLSGHYRAGGASAGAVASSADVLPYVVARLPATFAANAAVFDEVIAASVDFSPRDLLDVGAGPGTASWAAVEAWPELETVTMLDGNRHFLTVAGEFATAAPHAALSKSRRVEADIGELAVSGLNAELVVASFVLAELDEALLPRLIGDLWQASRGMLVLIEPGTPAGFRRIRQAREILLSAGARLAAPCPHGEACPIVASDWCHFSQRLPRSRDHRLAKAASLPFEDEKFSYVAAARPAVKRAVPAARVLAPPRVGKAEIRLKLCRPGGIDEHVVARRERNAYRRAGRLRWGSGVNDL